MWLDRQEVYLAWVGMITAFTLALAFLGVSAWLISTGHEVSARSWERLTLWPSLPYLLLEESQVMATRTPLSQR
jgi:K+ transporter